MFEIQNYTSFVLAILVFQLIPGPGTIAILNATARNGVAAGMGAVCGTLLGDLVFMLAAVAGLAAVMQANPLLFHTLQWFGAAYLCWMGVQLLRTRFAADAGVPEPRKSARVYLRQGFTVSLTRCAASPVSSGRGRTARTPQAPFLLGFQCGDCCCSMYWRMISRGAPPQLPAK